MAELPIDRVLPEIVASLRHHSASVIQASPGAGKTTRVPSALLDAGLAVGGQIIVLEPRRIAARAAADFVAKERGGRVGGEVGYRVRFDQRGSDDTRLWFVTEGMFTRQLARNPFLEGVSVVILDEFHERHVGADFALAAVLELQRSIRPDLKLAVMSATLEAERVAAHLREAALIRSEGRNHPVRIDYDPGDAKARLGERVSSAVRRVLAGEERGDMLVFLPGAGEIRRATEALAPLAAAADLELVPLHGDLPLEEQYRAIQPGRRRKIILSTNVAETALTVEGVTTVIDSGLARVARFDASHGINSLALARISRASAEQRAGRAGRVRPGVCVRLWSAADHQGRVPHDTPEILRLDLSELLLEIKAWGLASAEALPWLDPPSDSSWRRSAHLLELLGALEPQAGEITENGRRMLRLSVPPRLARMLIEADERGCRPAAAAVAALASERDICMEQRTQFTDRGANARLNPTQASDLLARLDLFREAARSGFNGATCRALAIDAGAVRAVERVRRQLLGPRSAALESPDAGEEDELLRCILAGFPDRVVRRREPGSARGVMVGGRGVVLDPASAVREADLFVAVELLGGRTSLRSSSGPPAAEAVVRVASAIDRRWLSEMFPQLVTATTEAVFDWERETVIERYTVRFRDLVLEESVRGCRDADAASAALAAAVRADVHRALAPKENVEALLERIAAARRWMPELDLPEPNVLLEDTAVALCAGRRSFAKLRALDLIPWLQAAIPQWRQLARELPTEYALPSGRIARIRYEPDRPPIVAARIQELFGLVATPRLARGRVPLLLELLAPNQRPVQITDDLDSFWRGTYAEVRKQLRGRYPKHSWPEDPTHAVPTSRARPR